MLGRRHVAQTNTFASTVVTVLSLSGPTLQSPRHWQVKRSHRSQSAHDQCQSAIVTPPINLIFYSDLLTNSTRLQTQTVTPV